MKKRGLCFLLILTLTLSLFAGSFSFAAEQACGDHLTWAYDEDTCTLTISGTGAMWDYTASADNLPPWCDYSRDIETVVMEEGVTTVGAYAFVGCWYLTSVSLPSTLTTIGVRAFRDSHDLEFEIPDSVTVLSLTYAVILASSQEGDTASVTLGFTDNTSDTFTVSGYQDEEEVLHTENFSSLFADNALVGDIVSVTFGSDSTVGLITEASFCSGSTQIKDGGMVYNDADFWATDDTPLFLLYTDGEGAKPVQFKVCSMARFPDYPAAAIPVYTSETSYQTLLGSTALPTSPRSYGLEIAVITYGTTPPTVTVTPNTVGYVVASMVKQEALSVSLIDAKTQSLVTGMYPYAAESDEFAVGTVVGYVHDGEEFLALETYASESALDTAYNGTAGFYKVTVVNADDDRLAFYPYGSTELTILRTSETYSAVGISGNRPVGDAVEVIPNGTVPIPGEYNAIIKLDYSGKIAMLWSLHDLMDGSTESAQPEVNASDYAVILRSLYSSYSDTAAVKLCFADNSVEEVTVTGYSDGNNPLDLSALDRNKAVGSLVTVTRADDGVTLTLAAPFVQGDTSIKNGTLQTDDTVYFPANDAPLFLLYTINDTSKAVGAVAYKLSDLADRTAFSLPVWTLPGQSENFCGAAVLPSSEAGYLSAAVMTFGIGSPGVLSPQLSTGYVVDSAIEYLSYFRQNAVRVTLLDRKDGSRHSGIYYDVASADLNAFQPGSIVYYRHDGLDFTDLELSQYGTLEFQENKLDTNNPVYGYYKVTVTAITDSSISFIAYGDTEVQTLPLFPAHTAVAIRSGAAIGNTIEVLAEPPESGYNAVVQLYTNGVYDGVLTIFSVHQGSPPIGDLIGDGAVDVYDAVLLFQHSMLPDLYPVNYDGSLDFNKDGTVDVYDAVLLFQHSMLPDLYPIE